MLECIDPKLGLVFIYLSNELNCIHQINSTINNSILSPGDKTTLDGFFDDFVTYLGIYDGYLQFEIGQSIDLFEHKIYVNAFKKIEENRIVTVYSPGTARDYIYKNGFWR